MNTEISTLVETEMKAFHDAVFALYETTHSWIDAVVQHATSLGLEIEDCAGMISPVIVARIQQEGEERKMLKSDNHIRLL